MKINYQISEILNEFSSLRDIPVQKQGRIFDLELENTAVLILDMQNYFLDEKSHAYLPAGKQIVQPICDLANEAIRKGVFVISTQHVDIELPENMMLKWWRNSIHSDSVDAELYKDIKELNTDLITKNQYDAFYNTGLYEILKSRGITQIIFTGVATHLCVETTIRSAFVNGFLPILPVDGTASFTKELHLNSIRNLEHGFAVITQMDHLKNELEMK